MKQLTSEGQRIVTELSQRYGFSTDAVAHMLFAVFNGNGTMAQFSHPEFAGSGQWMQGGMLMLGDMFNNVLRGNVDALCNEISGILSSQPGLLRSGSFQSQSQSGGGQQSQASGVSQGQCSLFVPDPEDHWWPADLGVPTSVGSQNNVRYAYFGGARRLAVKTGTQVWVYDTLDHQIGGFSQQQGMGSSIVFTSQYGTINLSTLPVVSRDGQPVQQAPMPETTVTQAKAGVVESVKDEQGEDIIDQITRLGELKEKGILTEEEFAAKKTQLLNRL